VRTGQSHRTLSGHSGPITALQFDEVHVVSGSLDKSIKVSQKAIFCSLEKCMDMQSVKVYILTLVHLNFRFGTCEQDPSLICTHTKVL
jgi:hypothetical protein